MDEANPAARSALPPMPAGRAAQVVVDASALRHNIDRIRHHLDEAAAARGSAAPELMAVMKADGYGHGLVETARTARAAGVRWLGVATIDEALAIRDAGDVGPLLCWLAAPGADYTQALRAGVDVTATSLRQLDEIIAAADATGHSARVHLMVDTGMSRDGAAPDQWPALTAAARVAESTDAITVVGVFSHLACADTPDHPANDAQEQAFRAALDVAAAAGLDPDVRHLANSAAALLRPSAHFDLVRVGIALYGFSPAPTVYPARHWDLRPAMTVRARLAAVRDIPAGAGVSYGHTFTADEPMRVGLVPMGYGDGIPRHASNTTEVLLAGERRPVLGRICMDQFVVRADGATTDDEVVVIGADPDGPTAQEWADRCATITYEIVTRMGGRPDRVWLDEAPS